MRSDMKRLDGQNAVITGGASGIGLATARLFLEEGARVTIADINREALVAAAESLRSEGPVHAVHADVSDMSQGARIIEEADAAHGGLDIVVCAAGIPSRSRLHKLEEAEWDRILGVNLKGIFTVVKAAVPKLKERGGGAIVTIGSEMGFVGDREAPAYNASKGGVIMFTKALALDLIADNIRVNSLCPGITQTGLLEQELRISEDPAATQEEFANWAPIGRTADAREQAFGVLFLAGREASFAVGATLLLDGGFTAR
jgi:NAD(P)-dependent dehydrogenase (short-subunit alcohol dehydrogenase family)